MNHYILGEHHAVVVERSLMKWAAWMTAARYTRAFIVRKTKLKGLEVSTVFLGLDHGFGQSALPVVFETMVFQDAEPGKRRRGGEIAFSGSQEQLFGQMRRYCTWHEALAGHEQAVAGLRKRLEPAGPGNVKAQRRRIGRLQEVFNGRVRATKPA